MAKKPKEVAPGSRWCPECETVKPETAFHKPKNRRNKQLFCFACGCENMARWARTRNVGMMPEDIKELAD